MEDALELGMEGLDRVTDKYYDKVYDKAKKHNPLSRKSGENNYPTEQSTVDGAPEDQQSERRYRENEKGASRTNSKRSGGAGRPRAQLPSPEPEDRDYYYHSSSQQPDGHNNTSSGTTPRRRAYYDSYYDDDPELERQSETSERVLRAYENEKDDPRRRPDPSLIGSARQRRSRPPKDSEMSYDYDRRPSSQQPRSRHYGDGDSDYDERTGTTHRKTSRGYDDGYDREIIETERYHGPARDWGNQRSPSFQDNDYQVTPYKKSGDVDRRSRSRGRSDRDDFYGDERRHHDRSRSREGESFKDKLDDTFDKSTRGIGVGIAGAVVGGLIARQVGDKRHSKRDMVIGAVIGGLGANAAEQKYRDWSDDRKEDRREERRDDRLAVPYDDYRSRSSHR